MSAEFVGDGPNALCGDCLAVLPDHDGAYHMGEKLCPECAGEDCCSCCYCQEVIADMTHVDAGAEA